MERTLDSFVIKRKSQTPEKKKDTNEEKEKTIEKAKKTPKKEPEVQAPTNQIKDNSKFFSTYDSFIDELGSWKEPLKSFINPPGNAKMKAIYTFVKKEYESKVVHPPKDQIFTAFKTTPFDKVKVVIIGQDPYPTPGDAMGMSFSVPPSQKVPKSLVNIYKCLDRDPKIKFTIPKHGDLTKWAEQGVFLLNATLTVVSRQANSHQKTSGWSSFTDYVINQISEKKKNVVFLLWGKFAIDKKKLINRTAHCVITNIHPSPLAASKGDFSASDQFSKVNEYLKQHNIEPIDWQN